MTTTIINESLLPTAIDSLLVPRTVPKIAALATLALLGLLSVVPWPYRSHLHHFYATTWDLTWDFIPSLLDSTQVVWDQISCFGCYSYLGYAFVIALVSWSCSVIVQFGDILFKGKPQNLDAYLSVIFHGL
jgi:hypothetical protein